MEREVADFLTGDCRLRLPDAGTHLREDVIVGEVVTPQIAPAPTLGAQSPGTTQRSESWLRAARQARLLAWASPLWMTLEGALGVVAGVQANSISVLTWAASSAVEGLASAIVIWRFSGHRMLSEHSERRAQRWVAASFFLLAP